MVLDRILENVYRTTANINPSGTTVTVDRSLPVMMAIAGNSLRDTMYQPMTIMMMVATVTTAREEATLRPMTVNNMISQTKKPTMMSGKIVLIDQIRQMMQNHDMIEMIGILVPDIMSNAEIICQIETILTTEIIPEEYAFASKLFEFL